MLLPKLHIKKVGDELMTNGKRKYNDHFNRKNGAIKMFSFKSIITQVPGDCANRDGILLSQNHCFFFFINIETIKEKTSAHIHH